MNSIKNRTGIKYAGIVLSVITSMIAGVVSAQQSYTFTNAGATGPIGPSQTLVNNAYNATNLSGAVTVLGTGVQQWSVPVTGAYGIRAIGASGATTTMNCVTAGGLGANIYGEVNLTAGQVLLILVGQQGSQSTNSHDGGGGGGSFVTSSSSVAIVVAGGGGGSTNNIQNCTGTQRVGLDGSLSTTGTNGANGSGAGGTNGSGGTGSGGGGGGGMLTNGTGGGPGFAFMNGGNGGTYSGAGGFGGGGSGYSEGGNGGGGGGYSGGGTNSSSPYSGGGGGGSFNSGINQVNAVATSAGHGRVIISRLCDLNLTASKNPICDGESVVIGSNAGSNILWNTGATSASITVSPSVTTGYTMSGVSSSSSACNATVSIMVVVMPLPVLAAYSFPPVVCQNGNGTLGASGASTYTWSTGGVGASVIVNPTVSDVYTVTGTSANGCVSSETVMMNVNTNVLTVAQTSAICKGSTATLTALGVVNALWSNGATFLTIQVAPTTNTVYTVTGMDNIGCPLTGAASVNVLNLPSITITSDKQTVCQGESVVLTANGGVSYVWDNAEITQSVTKNLPVNVPYQYSVTGTDANGCKSKANITVEASACTGVEEYKTNAINIYPNPVNSALTISGGNTMKKVVVISDIYGRTLIVAESSSSDINVNVETLPAGVYNIQVTENDLNTIQKFIKL